jgi:hypothetical protein
MTLQQLIRFYLACIEVEDSKAARKPLSALHHSVISPWNDEEALFSKRATSVELETTTGLRRVSHAQVDAQHSAGGAVPAPAGDCQPQRSV